MKNLRDISMYIFVAIGLFYLFDCLFPATKTWIQLSGALLVNAIFYDMSNRRILIRYTSLLYIFCKRDILKYLSGSISNSKEELDKLRKRIYKWMINDNRLSKTFIDKCDPVAASGLIIAMQGHSDLKCEELTFVDFKTLAAKAATLKEYRLFLARSSSESFPTIRDHLGAMCDKEHVITGDDLRTISDQSFCNELRRSNQEILHIFSTISQLSKELIDLISELKQNIAELHFYIISPFIISDNALTEIQKEYRNPSFSIKTDQQVCDASGKPHPELDTLRRVLRILASISSLYRSNLPFKIYLHFFKTKYPGIKIKLLEKSRFAQFQPGSLSYQNNLYRFGIELRNGDEFSALFEDLRTYAASEHIDTHVLSEDSYRNINQQSIKEMSSWLFSRGITEDTIGQYQKAIHRVAKIGNDDHNLVKIMSLLRSTQNMFSDFDIPACIPGTNNQKLHLSVGALIKNGNKILIIHKSDPFYSNKLSIVAGHVNNSETPLQAIYREVNEELGVKVTGVELIGRAEHISDLCRYGVQQHLWFLFSCRLDSFDFNVDKTEIAKCEWISKEQFTNMSEHFTPASLFMLSREDYFK